MQNSRRAARYIGFTAVAVIVSAALAAVTLASAAAECTADAEVLSSWVEDGGFKLFAKVRVEPDNCERGCNGAVEGRFHYERSDGWSNRASTISTWTITSRQRAKEVVLDSRAINCSKEKPCEIHEFQITKVTCRY